MNRIAPLTLIAATVLILCGLARSEAIAQGPPSRLHSNSPVISSRVSRPAVVPAPRDVQVAFFAMPNRTDYLQSNDVAPRVAPMRVITRVTSHRVLVKPDPIIEFTPALAPGKRSIVKGIDGLRVITERVTMWDNVAVERAVVSRITVRGSRPAHILEGAPRTLSQLKSSSPYHKLIHVYTMEATAYTALTAKAYPTGYTANGMIAKYGIVAVDPDVIPLGTHVFIPGYGLAIAADTGGAIIGRRIDLCMDRYGDAVRFGRQPVTVYVVDR